MEYTDATAVWTNAEEAKQTIVEESLLAAFNPFVSLEEKSRAREMRSVVSYTVRPGDTLSAIAHRYGVSLQQLVTQNKLENPHLLGIGLKLVVRRNEAAHTVQPGETLEAIAGRYQVKTQEIVDANPLLRVLSGRLYVGQVLYIPLAAGEPMLAGNFAMRRQLAQVASRSAAAARLLDWPVQGATVTSGFGVRWGRLHKGIDLWNEKEGSTPILAAKEGVVIEAGAHGGGYGYLVVIDHGDGLHTYYAHLRRILVFVGQMVKRGQILGYMGRSGDSTGYHLHFEVRQDEVPLNPIRYLRR